MIVVKHVDSIFGSLLPIRLSTFKLVYIHIIVCNHIYIYIYIYIFSITMLHVTTGRPGYALKWFFLNKKKYIYINIW